MVFPAAPITNYLNYFHGNQLFFPLFSHALPYLSQPLSLIFHSFSLNISHFQASLHPSSSHPHISKCIFRSSHYYALPLCGRSCLSHPHLLSVLLPVPLAKQSTNMYSQPTSLTSVSSYEVLTKLFFCSSSVNQLRSCWIYWRRTNIRTLW